MSHLIHSRIGVIASLAVAVLVLLSLLVAEAAAQDIVIVVNKTLSVNDVTTAEIKAIFLGKKRIWDTGQEIVFAIFDDAAIQETFMQKYLQKSSWQFRNYWTQRVFSGRGRMPRFLASKQEVVKFVQNTPGAISFLPAPAGQDVKILKVK